MFTLSARGASTKRKQPIKESNQQKTSGKQMAIVWAVPTSPAIAACIGIKSAKGERLTNILVVKLRVLASKLFAVWVSGDQLDDAPHG